MKKKYIIFVFVLLVPLLLTGCFGGAGNSGIGDNNGGSNGDLNGEWSVYNNDYISIDYPNEWYYVDENDFDNVPDGEYGVIFSNEEIDIEGIYFNSFSFQIMIMNYQEMIYEVPSVDYAEDSEDFVKQYEEFLEQDISEEEDIIHSEIRSTTIDGQYAFELDFIYESDIIYEIYYDLIYIKEDIEEIKDIMDNYNDAEDFVENITLEELAQIKEILENNEEGDDYIEDINIYLDQETTELLIESIMIFTHTNDKVIYINAEGFQEPYQQNENIVERMIDSIGVK